VTDLRILREADDVTPEIEALLPDVVDWFDGDPMPTEEFIDRLCKDYADGWDIENYDTPAVRKIMRIARRIRAAS
jgi:hypothetical protein